MNTPMQPSLEGQPAQRVDVVVPVLNEREMLPRFLSRIQALDLPLNLIFVDNGSTDGTLEFLALQQGAKADIQIIAHGRNMGYGRSLADGLRASTAARVIIIDADCEYPPEALPDLLAALELSPMVYASRFRGAKRIAMAPFRRWGNRGLTGFFNLLYGQHLTDLYTGMKALRRTAFEGLTFTRNGFEHVMELSAKVARRGVRIGEVPVAYAPRQTGRSKMRHIPEFLKAVYCLLYYRRSRHE
jgi:glycosyltransferase involved in cell wall biosynthesis